MFSKYLSRRRSNFEEDLISTVNEPQREKGVVLPVYFQEKAVYTLDYAQDNPTVIEQNKEEIKSAMSDFKVEKKDYLIAKILPSSLKHHAEGFTQFLMIAAFYLLGVVVYNSLESWTFLGKNYFINIYLEIR
jgi:hypothetical protein